MALLFCSGFCDGVGGMWDTIGNGSISTVVKRSGTYSFRLNLQLGYMTKTIPTPISEVYLQMCMNITNVLNCGDSSIMEWRNGNTVLGTLVFDKNNFKVYLGDRATLLATSSWGQKFVDGTWGVVEVYVKIADDNVDPDLAGRIIVRLNGEVIISFTGDTKPGAETDMNSFWFGVADSSWNNYTYIDDIIIDSSEWPNSAYVSPLLPTGAGTFSQWTPSSGSNFECVDEVPPVITDNILSNTVDQKDLYGMSDLPATALIIKGLIWYAYAAKVGSPTPLTLKPLLLSESTENLGSVKTPRFDDFLYSEVYVLSPFTSNPWTPAEINALEVGIKSLT